MAGQPEKTTSDDILKDARRLNVGSRQLLANGHATLDRARLLIDSSNVPVKLRRGRQPHSSKE